MSQYCYEPLNLNRQEIRLIQIIPPAHDHDTSVRLRIRVVNLEAASTFYALSYVWGSPAEVHTCLISGDEDGQMLIRTNLYQCLLRARQIRQAQGQWFRIDQICIDQSSEKEKNHQVANMGSIYRAASATVIWINIGVCLDQTRRPWRIVSNSYWQRTWIIQEVLLSTNRVVLTPYDVMSWKRLCELQDEIGLVSRFSKIRESAANQLEKLTSWRSACKLCSGALVSDPRDKVYGLLELVDDSIRLHRDYGLSVRQVAIRTTIAELFHNSPLDGSGTGESLESLWCLWSDLGRTLGLCGPLQKMDIMLPSTLWLVHDWLVKSRCGTSSMQRPVPQTLSRAALDGISLIRPLDLNEISKLGPADRIWVPPFSNGCPGTIAGYFELTEQLIDDSKFIAREIRALLFNSDDLGAKSQWVELHSLLSRQLLRSRWAEMHSLISRQLLGKSKSGIVPIEAEVGEVDMFVQKRQGRFDTRTDDPDDEYNEELNDAYDWESDCGGAFCGLFGRRSCCGGETISYDEE